eukprot:TRINITY_DN2012_c0_g1_i1.p1 TRINITY_DN2012_c0_g1~~TRINITY_DN2012_c0_g1_i1.p1  ORF type:complete len:767 (-),score=253.57 TRINITY_DN2012_c0_g1_i1:463-2763(-)
MSSAGQLRLLRKAEKMGGGLGVGELTMKGRLKSFVMRHRAHLGKEEQRSMKFEHESGHDAGNDESEHGQHDDNRHHDDEQPRSAPTHGHRTDVPDANGRRTAAEVRREREEAERLAREEDEARLRKKAAARRKKVHIEELPLPEPKPRKKKRAQAADNHDGHSIDSSQEVASVGSGGHHDGDQAARCRADSLASTLSSENEPLSESGEWLDEGAGDDWLDEDSDDDDYVHHRHGGVQHPDEPGADHTDTEQPDSGATPVPTPAATPAPESSSPPTVPIPPEATARLYLTCSKTATPGQLKYVCGKYPGLTYIDLKLDKKTNQSKGFAFVGYKSVAAAVVARNGISAEVLCGQKIRALFAAPPTGPGRGPKTSTAKKATAQPAPTTQGANVPPAAAGQPARAPSAPVPIPDNARPAPSAAGASGLAWAAVAKAGIKHSTAAEKPAVAKSTEPSHAPKPEPKSAASAAKAAVKSPGNGRRGRRGAAAAPAEKPVVVDDPVNQGDVTVDSSAAVAADAVWLDHGCDASDANSGGSPTSSGGSPFDTRIGSPAGSKPPTPPEAYQSGGSPPPAGAYHHQAGQPVFSLGPRSFICDLDLNFFHTDEPLLAQMAAHDVAGARELERVAAIEVGHADADVRRLTVAAREAQAAASAAADAARRAVEAARLAEQAAQKSATDLQAAVMRSVQARENLSQRTAEIRAAAEREQLAQLAAHHAAEGGRLSALHKPRLAPVARPMLRVPLLDPDVADDDEPLGTDTFAEELLMSLLS